jgi:hypothetical protein
MNLAEMFVHKSTRAIWGELGWAFLHHSPCKNGRIWIIADPKSDKWDLVRWDQDEWDSQRGVDFSKVLRPICKPLSIHQP